MTSEIFLCARAAAQFLSSIPGPDKLDAAGEAFRSWLVLVDMTETDDPVEIVNRAEYIEGALRARGGGRFGQYVAQKARAGAPDTIRVMIWAAEDLHGLDAQWNEERGAWEVSP